MYGAISHNTAQPASDIRPSQADCLKDCLFFSECSFFEFTFHSASGFGCSKTVKQKARPTFIIK